MLDPITKLAFSVYENPNVYALLLGSGISRSAHIPTGWEITLELIERVAILQGEDTKHDPGKWYAEKYAKQPDYSEILNLLTITPHERRAILHKFIEPTDDDLEEGKRIPTAAHHAIAKLVKDGYLKVIITTNFDRLLESALAALGIQPHVISSDDGIEGAIPLQHAGCVIVKVHGDYLDPRIKNVSIELAEYSPLLQAYLARIFDEYGLIVCGWSAEWDVALKSAITRSPNRRYPTFWASRGNPKPIAAELIAQKSAIAIEIENADTFFSELYDKVLVQAENPKLSQSVELLISLAEKYVANAGYRIKLNELVHLETKRLSEILPPLVNEDTSFTTVQRHLVLYPNKCESLSKICGVIGRWGDADAQKSVIEMLPLFAQKRSVSGLDFYIELLRFPALLLYYSFALPALKAGNLLAVFEAFSVKFEYQGNVEPSTIARSLFLQAWPIIGNEKNFWNFNNGTTSRLTPFSEYLNELMGKWLEKYFSSKQEFENFFALFEILGAFAYLTQTSSPEDLNAVAANVQPSPTFRWCPFGMAVWNGTGKTFAIGFINDNRGKLLSAGFAKGESQFLDLMISNFEKVAVRARW